MNMDERVMRECQRRGTHPSAMTRDELHGVVKSVMRPAEKLVAGAKITSTVIRTKVPGVRRVVPLPVYEARKAFCPGCPTKRFYRTLDDQPACLGCGCSGKLLDMRWWDPRFMCPDGHFGRYTGVYRGTPRRDVQQVRSESTGQEQPVVLGVQGQTDAGNTAEAQESSS